MVQARVANTHTHTHTQWNTEMSEPDLHVSTRTDISGEWGTTKLWTMWDMLPFI